MQLPRVFEKLIGKKEKKIEYFLSLLFTENKVKAAVWKREDGVGETLGVGEKETSGKWEETIKDADEAISKATTNIPQEKIKKVIFGLPYSWTEDNKIKEPHLSNLKKLASDLSLVPIGFIVVDEAIIHFLSKEEGTPATVILLGFKKEKFYLTLSRVGKVEGIKEKERKEGVALCEEIAKTLKEFPKVEVLPSKILLYDGTEDLEGIKQELISYPWLTKAEFLHFPKIEILENDSDLKALVLCAATEMGMTLKKKEQEEGQEERKMIETLKGKEILEPGERASVPSDLGFVKDKDIVEELPPEMSDLIGIKEEQEEREEKEKEVVEEERKIKPPAVKFKLPAIPKLSFDLELLNNFKSIGIIIGFVLAFLFFLTILAYWRLPHAKVILLVTPKVLEKEEEIIVDPHITVLSLKKRKIPGIEVEVKKEGEKTAKATGKKIVGEKARGEVTIFNKTNYTKKFNAGTILTGPNGLKFTLDEDITVASQSSTSSSDESVILTPGKAKVKVTALQIGAESNLAKNTEFRIEDYSIDNYKAKNESDAFSGGLSREVSVVSEDDQKKIVKALTDELTKKAKKELGDKVGKGKNLIEDLLETQVVNKKFSKEIEDEADEFTLNLSLKFKTLAYNNLDLENILLEIIGRTTPKGYEYKKEEVEKEIKEVKIEKDKSVTLKIYFKINLLPKIDVNKVRKDLAGKNLKAASIYLNKIPNVAGFEAKISPKFPGIFYTFPRIAKNIEIELRRK